MTWIRNTKANLEGNNLIIFCEDAFHRDLYSLSIISSTVLKLLTKNTTLGFI